MNEFIEFIEDNIISIIIVVIVIFFILVIFDILNIDFKLKTEVDLNTAESKTITIETFADSFCKVSKHDHNQLESDCNKFDKEGCNTTDCCVYVTDENGVQCKGGNERGPHFNGTKKNPLNILTYFYKNKCYEVNGKCT